MKNLMIVRGLPGSGKTTFATKLVDQALGKSLLYHYEADMYFQEGDKYVFNPTKLADAHTWCQNMTRKALSASDAPVTVVVSNTFTTWKEILPYVCFAKGVRALLTIVECTGNHESVHGVPPATIEKMRARWEPTDVVALRALREGAVVNRMKV